MLQDTGTDIPNTLGAPADTLAADIGAVKTETDAIVTDTGTTLPAQISAIGVVGGSGVNYAVEADNASAAISASPVATM